MDLDKTFLSFTIGRACNLTSAEVSLPGLTDFVEASLASHKFYCKIFSQKSKCSPQEIKFHRCT